MTIGQAWDLSQRWYGNRLDADFRRPTVDEAQAIFAAVGLTGVFWNLDVTMGRFNTTDTEDTK